MIKAAPLTLEPAEAGCGHSHMSPKGNCHLPHMASDSKSGYGNSRSLEAQVANFIHIIFATFCWTKQVTRLVESPEIRK